MGWAVGDGESLPRCGAFNFAKSGENLGLMLHQLAGAVEAHLDIYKTEVVAYEEPILIKGQRFQAADSRWHRRSDNLATLRKTIPLGARIEEICHVRGIPCYETSVASVKKELAGLRTAKKSEMVAAAEKLGVSLPDGPGREDAADAIGGWLLLLRLRQPKLSVKFDQAIWGRRSHVLL